MKQYFDFKTINDLSKMQILLKEFSLQMDKIGLRSLSLRKVKLVIEELFANIIKYGYRDMKESIIELKVIPNRKSLRIEICDNGIPFDPTLIREHTVANSVEDLKIGGLGLIIVRKSCRRMKYKRYDNKNFLSLTVAVCFENKEN
ncbi:MAG: ATP-binding protein [Lentisphaerota bacterium]